MKFHIFHKWIKNKKKKIKFEKHYFFDGYVNIKLIPIICEKCGKEEYYKQVSPFIFNLTPEWWDY